MLGRTRKRLPMTAGLAKRAAGSELVAECVVCYRSNLFRMDYPEYRRRDLPVGSGVIETGSRTIMAHS